MKNEVKKADGYAQRCAYKSGATKETSNAKEAFAVVKILGVLAR
jgi:hypothetical protein